MLNEETLINKIAEYERSIPGVKNSYGYSQNPDNIVNASLPAVLHYIPEFISERKASFNVWKNELVILSLVFVMPREAQGGKLKFVENAAIPFGRKWRDKFQEEATIRGILGSQGAQIGFLEGGRYGVGGFDTNTPELMYGETAYIGWVMRFRIAVSN